MRCSKAREAMLVAERSALRGADESELSQHLRECAACRSLATAIENETALLASTVAQRGSSMVDAPAVARPRARLALAVTALPIAATIVIGAVLQTRGREAQPDPRAAAIADGRVAVNVVSVDVEPGQTATVIRTRDPKVTIVWISPGGTQ